MTMFKKVFGSQMAASEMSSEQIPEPMEPVIEEPTLRPPRSKPLLAPVPQVLTMKEEENAARRAEYAADLEENLRQQQKAPQTFKIAPAPAPEPEPTPAPIAAAKPDPEPDVAPPATLPPARPAGRARTRLLGFGGATDPVADPMAGPVATPDVQQFPTGWIVVTDGPGRGHFFALYNGVSTVGRDDGQTIALRFGDMTISRENHAAIAYDEEAKQFFVGHGGKSNIIRLNGRPVLSTEPLGHGDVLRIGETVLRFVALCGADFDWAVDPHD